MAKARLTTERRNVYELVELTDDARFILEDAGGGLRVFEEWSRAEMLEIRCDECGKWTAETFPQGGGRWLCAVCSPP